MSGEYSFASSYQPGFSSFENYGLAFPGYQGKITAGSLSMTFDPRTANVIKEIGETLNMGVKNIELPEVSAQVLEAIPKGHLKEVNQMAKLVGAETTMHAPVLNVSGVGERGFDETQRQLVERQLTNAIDRAHELNPDKSAPVTIHSSEGLPGNTWQPGKEGMEMARMMAVNIENGELTPLDKDIMYSPGEIARGKTEGEINTPEDKLRMINNTKWDNSVFQIEQMRENVDRITQGVHPMQSARIAQLTATMSEEPEKMLELIKKEGLGDAYSKFRNANEFVKQANTTAGTLFSNAYEISKKSGDKKSIEKLNEVAQNYSKAMGIEDSEKGKIDPIKYLNPENQSQALTYLVDELKKVPVKSYVPYEDFVIDKSAETFSNLALHSYQKYKDKAPIISIENPPVGHALSTGEDLNRLVEETQKRFIEKAQEDGMSKSKAKEVAEKLIGVTWDVGHINMLRKQGFDENEIIKQTEKIAPHLKHVHLSDNFGLEHTELPMGMGNVPMKEIMEKLGEKGYEAKKVVEASSWWQHFSQGGKHNAPFMPTLQGVGGSVYSGSGGPYWNQNVGLSQDYSSGFGMMLPSVNYETFGAGFSALPAELGGTRAGGQGGRMSGRGME